MHLGAAAETQFLPPAREEPTLSTPLEHPIKGLPPGIRLARDAVFRDIRGLWGLTDKTSKFLIGSGESTGGKAQFDVSIVLKDAENWTRNTLVCCTRNPDQKHNMGVTRSPPHRRNLDCLLYVSLDISFYHVGTHNGTTLVSENIRIVDADPDD